MDGAIVDLMMGKNTTLKYNDPWRPLVDVVINDIVVEGALTDIGVATSVMTMQIMKRLGLPTLLQRTQIVLQMVDRSTTMSEGVLEDVIITIVAWDYPGYFLVLKPKKEGGYPMILGRLLLPTANAKLGLRSRELEITHDGEKKWLSLYPLQN